MKLKTFSNIFLVMLAAGLLSLIPAHAQDGTTVSTNQINFESTFSGPYNSMSKLNRIFQVQLHVPEDESGNQQVNYGELQSAWDLLNQVFGEIGVSFELTDTNIVTNHQFDSIAKNGELEIMLTTQHVVENKINLYLIKQLRTSTDVCGYAYMPGDSADIIFVDKDCLDGGVLIRQFGHFFNLYNTHETILGTESIDRTDCSVNGDKCCDTPADPGLSGMVDADCKYTGNAQLSGSYYAPVTTNYMSEAPAECKCYLSEQQYIRMLNAMVTVKNHLW